MIEYLGDWTSKAKVEGSPIEDFHFGKTRVARITMSFSTTSVQGKDTTYKMFQHRIYLPGVGPDDIGFSWSMSEAKRKVEATLRGWLVESGIQGFLDGAVEFEQPFIMPDEIIVLEGIKAAPASAKIIPLKPRSSPSLPPLRQSYSSVKEKSHRKSGGKLSSRGQ